MEKSKVWVNYISAHSTTEELKTKTDEILKASNLLSIVSKKKIVAVKQHFGEVANKGFIKPEVTRVVINKIKERQGKPILIETNTLYRGGRSNTYDHLTLAYEHGFTYDKVGAPIMIMDGLNGQNQVPVEINGKHFKEVYVVSDIPFFDSMVVLSHVKGHLMAGYGGAIKNLGMGLASRAGKLAQHADFKPSLKKKLCVACGMCQKNCNHGAICVENKEWKFDASKCAGCGECYTACPRDAITFNWDAAEDKFQEKLAEYAYGAAKELKERGKIVFVNYIYHVTKFCDCEEGENPIIGEDVAVLASADPVAIDKASSDLVTKHHKKDLFKEAWKDKNYLRHIEHAGELGLGNMDYEMIEI